MKKVRLSPKSLDLVQRLTQVSRKATPDWIPGSSGHEPPSELEKVWKRVIVALTADIRKQRHKLSDHGLPEGLSSWEGRVFRHTPTLLQRLGVQVVQVKVRPDEAGPGGVGAGGGLYGERSERHGEWTTHYAGYYDTTSGVCYDLGTFRSFSWGGSGCFPRGTPVSTDQLHITIDALTVGDCVLGYDFKQEVNRPQTVVNVYRHEAQPLVFLQFEGQSFMCTPGQRLFADRWTAAADLRVGDKLLRRDGTHLKLIAPPQRAGSADVFNIGTTPSHCYFVGDAEILAHNKKEDEVEYWIRWTDDAE